MMDRQEALGTVDRATWRAWQFSNVALWSLAGIAAATVVHVIAGNINTIVQPHLVYPTSHTVRLWLELGDLLIAGGALGSIIGRHVFRSAPAYAGIAATIGLFLPVRLEINYGELSLIPALALTVAAAFAFAVRSERRRPLALRGGRVTQ
jgi:uncharacterized membrane protein SpoIIM required for sporulation